jgi:class 3 adenylate cyclase
LVLSLLGGALAGGVAAGLPLGEWLPLMPGEVAWLTPWPGRVAGGAVAGLVAALVGNRVDGWGHRLLLAAAGSLLAVTQSLVVARHGVVWPPLGVVAGILAGMIFGGMVAVRPPVWRRWLRSRVSARVMDRIHAAGGAAAMVPDEREAVVVTCRVLNETAMRGQMEAAAFLKMNSAFAAAVASVLREHGALTDEAEPGTVRGIFGLPLAVADPADAAAAAAVAIDDVLREFAASWMTRERDPVEWGIGIACGTLTAGLGEHGYSVAGDAIDRSKWLALLNGEYHSRILTDDTVHRLAERSEDRPLEVVNPPEGAAVELFQLLGQSGGLSGEALARRDAFRDAVMLLRAGHAEDALLRFAEARKGLLAPDPVLERMVGMAEEEKNRGGTGARRGVPRNATRR